MVVPEDAEPLYATVDPGVDRGGQDLGAIRRLRFHPWETRSTLAVSLAARCNHDVSILDHLPPDDDDSRAALQDALNKTRDATSAAIHYIRL